MITFDQRIKEDVASLVVFEHADSEDSKKIEELVAGLRDKYGSRLNLLRVDGTHDQRLRDFYGIKKYPTWILFRKGEELARESGMKSESNLQEMVKTAME